MPRSEPAAGRPGRLGRLARRWREGESRAARRTAAVAVPVVVAVGALVYPGLSTTHVDVDDGGVWVTNDSALTLARYNITIDDLTGGLVATSQRLDVLQETTDVLLLEPGRVSVVDPTTVSLATRVDVPPDAQVSLGGDRVLVSDPSTGRAWLRELARLATLRVDTDPADLEVGLGGVVALGTDGVARALTASGEESIARVDGEEVTVTEVGERPSPPSGSWRAATVVGEDLVALDGVTLSLPQAVVELPAPGELQASSDAADVVAVATSNALVTVPLTGGEATVTATGGGGLPAQPVRLGACVHAAWATPERNYAVDCDGDDAGPSIQNLQDMTTAAEPVFRVNRNRLVLNDVAGGYLWVPTESPERREPAWESVTERDDADPDDSPDQVVTNERTECTDEASDPLATPDAFGVRPGATAILPVLDNDSSRACGVLAVASLTPLPESFGTLTPVYDGRAVQVTIAPGATGTATFRYTVSDGRPTTTPAEAEVTLTVRGPGENGPPTQVRTQTVRVEQGGQVRYDVLGDFLDPDGDELRLLAAEADGAASVSIDPDGMVTVRPDGSSLGRQIVTVLVTDGGEPVEGTFVADVVAPASMPPQLGPLHATTVVDVPVRLRPLEAVLSRGAEAPRLAGVGEVTGLSVEADLAHGLLTVTAAAPGSYVLPYSVTAGSQEARGYARIDVVAPEATGALVATRDVLYLPATGEASLDPMANDVVPPGVATMLLDVTPSGEAAAALDVSVSEHRIVTVRQRRTLEGPVELTYTMTDGVVTATGSIAVVPLPPASRSLAPQVTDAQASVRTGGVVTIDVLAGASDPDGQRLALDPEVVEHPAAGRVYVTGDVVRYQAPETPGAYEAKVAVLDESGNAVTARIRIDVHASDPETKAPPRPEDVATGVFAGETVRIEIPLVGIDDDGDGVMLQGPASAPTLGRITDVGSTWLEYEALPDATGTDTFGYAVEDWTGQRARGSVRVAVAARPASSNTVTALDDEVTIRPGQSVLVPVLDNDTDALGAPLALEETLENDWPDLVGTVVDGAIQIDAPDADGVANILYTVTTPTGGRDQALLTVQVRADASLLPPVAADVVVRPVDTIEKTQVEVDVLSVARNPSGPVSALTVSVPQEYADQASVRGGTVVVRLGETTRTIPYLLTSPDVPTPGIAFITVPALGNFPPVMRTRAPALTVVSGETLTFELSDHVKVAPGKEAVVTDAGTATATRGGVVLLSPTSLQFTPQEGYHGPASVSVEVADGAAALATTRTSLLTFPITVLAPEAYPPVFAETTLDVGAGDGPVGVDLANLTRSVADASGTTQRYSFAIDGATPAGFEVSLDGSRLVASAPPTLAPGTRGWVPLAISYGGAEPLAARVELRAVPTTKPLARVLDRTVTDAKAGATITVGVLDGAYNPFPTPLQLVGAAVVAGTGTAAVTGDAVAVTPEPGRAQVLTIRFQVADATGDPGRTVEGTLTVTVIGPPDAPPAPSAVPGDTTVDLTWSPPAQNGAPITAYLVTAQPGGQVTTCAGTACTITGLTNATEYTFSVVAVNAAGESPPGASSAPVRPDVIPEAPTGLTVTRGDRALTVAWNPAVTRGSAVATYLLEVTPGGRRIELAGTALATTLEGLTNGTEYTVRVQAVNARGAGPWSGEARGVPAGVPFAPAAPSVPNEYRPGGDGVISVSWAPADGNGDAVQTYEVELTGGAGAQVASVVGTQWTSPPLTMGQTYSVRVRARNGVGWSEWGPSSSARVWTQPGVPTGLSVAASTGTAPGAGTVTISWTAPGTTGGEGITIAHYRVDWVANGVARSTTTGSTSLTLDGLSGGTTVSGVAVAAVSSVDATGPAASSGEEVRVVTLPAVTSLSVSVLDTDRIRVEWSASDGGASLVQVQLRLDGAVVGGASAPGPGDTSWTSAVLDPGYHEIELRVRTDAGWSAPRSDGATIAAPSPSPSPEPSPSETDP